MVRGRFREGLWNVGFCVSRGLRQSMTECKRKPKACRILCAVGFLFSITPGFWHASVIQARSSYIPRAARIRPEIKSADWSDMCGTFVFPIRLPAYRKMTDTTRDMTAVGSSFSPVMLAPMPMPKLLMDKARPRRPLQVHCFGFRNHIRSTLLQPF